MPEFTVEITVEGSLSDLASMLRVKAEEATMRGAREVIVQNQKLIAEWGDYAKPMYSISDPTGDTEVSRTVRAIGAIWNWVNAGTKPVKIALPRGRHMLFKWTGERSYNSSYEPKTPAGGGSGSGLQRGNPFRTRRVGYSSERYIRPRNFAKRAIKDGREAIMAAMRSAFK